MAKVTLVETAGQGTADAAESIASAIEAVASAMTALTAGRLKERAILLLLHDLTGLPMREIKLVLDAVPKLANYLQPAKVPRNFRAPTHVEP